MNTPFLLAGVINVANKKNPFSRVNCKILCKWYCIGCCSFFNCWLGAMNGFERELNQRILAVVPHIEIFFCAS